MSNSEKDIILDLEKGALNAHEAVQLRKDLDQEEIHSDLDNEISTQRRELEKLKLGTSPDKWLDTKQATRLQQSLDQATDPQSKHQILQEIQSRRDMFQNWGDALKEGDNVKLEDGTQIDTIFTLDKTRGYDSKEYYTEKFIALSESEQKKWLAEIQTNIAERKRQFNTLLRLVSPDVKDKELQILQKQTRQERNDYLKLYTQHQEILKKLNLDSLETASLQLVFSEMGQRAKKVEIERLQENLRQPKFDEQFKSASAKLRERIQKQEGFTSFQNLTLAEKRKVIEQMKDMLRADYKALYSNNPDFNQADIKQFDSWANSNTWNFPDFEACITYFPESITIAAEAAQEAKKCSPETLFFFKWDFLTAFDKHQLIKSGELLDEEHNGLRQKYRNKLAELLPGKKYGKYGLLTPLAAKKYEDWFKAKSTQDKQDILSNGEKHDFLQKTLKERAATNKKFEALPKQYQTEYQKQYLEAGHEERIAIVKSIPELDNELSREFADKIQNLIEQNLVSPHSLEAYLKWFAELNIKDKTEHLLSSDLDNTERQAILDTFEEEILPNASDEEAKKLRKQFSAADLDKRKKLIKQWAKLYKTNTDLEEIIEEATDKAELESNPILESLSTVAVGLKILFDTAQNFANQGKTETALDLYNKWLEQAEESPEEIPKNEIETVKDKIKQLKAEDIKLEHHDEPDQDPALNNQIHDLAEDISAKSPQLQSDIEQYTVLFEMGQILKRNEQLIKQQTGTARLRKTLKKADYQELDDALQAETDSQLSFEDGQYQVTKPNLIDLTTYGANSDLEKTSKNYIIEQMETKAPIDRHDISFGVIHDGKELTADLFHERLLARKKAKIDNQLSSEIIQHLQQTHPQIDANKFVPQIIASKHYSTQLKAGKNLRSAA